MNSPLTAIPLLEKTCRKWLIQKQQSWLTTVSIDKILWPSFNKNECNKEASASSLGGLSVLPMMCSASPPFGFHSDTTNSDVELTAETSLFSLFLNSSHGSLTCLLSSPTQPKAEMQTEGYVQVDVLNTDPWQRITQITRQYRLWGPIYPACTFTCGHLSMPLNKMLMFLV